MSKFYNALNSFPKMLAILSVGWLAPVLYLLGLLFLTIGISQMFPLLGIGWITFGCGIFVPSILFVTDGDTATRLKGLQTVMTSFTLFIFGLSLLGWLVRMSIFKIVS